MPLCLFTSLSHAEGLHFTAFLLKQPFTILCDGGNENFENIYFGIMVRFRDEKLRKVVTRLLDAPVCNIATGESLFKAIADALEARQINTMEKCDWFCLG